MATVNASTGAVTIVGAGSTTITASQAASGNYSSGSANYALTVAETKMIEASAVPDRAFPIQLLVTIGA